MTQADTSAELSDFIQQFCTAFEQNQLLRLVLSRYEGPQTELQRLRGRVAACQGYEPD